ncbi:apolipoprotein N-acyltransferase [Marinobacter sp. LN3S78]|uniref:apolipoprotein N-acyltransferase n=1 Tax=Marinobacter sp. LN3S78 TaxID=3382300 RepID=UPI00387A89E1
MIRRAFKVGWLAPLLGALATGIMLAVPYNYAGFYFLTWVAFVPLLLAAHGRGYRAHYLLGLATGLGMYLVATPWMAEFLQRLKDYPLAPALAGATLFWLLTSQLPALLMVSYLWLQRRLDHHALWAFPILLMLFYGWFPVLFPLQLGESQSAFLPAIQGASLTGVYGLDFMIGVSNALVTAAILLRLGREPALGSRGSVLAATAGVLALMVWLGFGWWSLAHWDGRVAQWPRLPVGLVQPNETPSASVPDPEAGYARAWPPEMEVSEQLVAAGAEVVLWPETRYKGYFEVDHLPDAYQRNVSALGVPLIFHDAEQQHQEGDFREYNTALFLGGNGELAARYRKHRLVAFGETLPLSREFPWLVNWAEDYLGDFFANLTPGTERVTFPVNGAHLVPAICYESAFPGHIARSVAAAPASPLLVVLSNNGWFGDSRQPYQHAGATVLRAVENRVSLVHAINNGPSTVVSPSGRILAATPFRQRSGLVSDVPYTPPAERFSSWFTRWPEWFVVASLGLLVTGSTVLRLRRRSRG